MNITISDVLPERTNLAPDRLVLCAVLIDNPIFEHIKAENCTAIMDLCMVYCLEI